MIQKKLIVIGMCVGSFALMSPVSAQESEGGSSSGNASTSESIARVQGMNTSLVKPVQPTRPTAYEPRTHQVVEGDTLWSLSSQYLSDPLMWPALWSYNPQVTNPHWLYPGDTIYLEPRDEAAAELTTAPQDSRPTFMARPKMAPTSLNVPGIYLDKLPETRGHILFSDQEKHMIAPGDYVQVDWVDIEMRKKISNGQRFTVFSQSKAVKNENGDDMAYKLIRQGVIEIVDARNDTLSTAQVIQSSREIERGMLILPSDDLVFTVESTPSQKSLEGRVIDSIDLVSQLASEQFVIVNRGSSDGVAKGNRWLIFEQREGLGLLPKGEQKRTQYAEENKKRDDEEKDLRDGEIEREDEHSWVLGHEVEMHIFPEREEIDEAYGDRDYTTADLPLNKIGEILVVDVQEKFCTGLILANTREIGIDTRVVMVKGY